MSVLVRERIGAIEEVLAAGPILVLAPHPDDESLGCGMLLAAAFRGSGAVVAAMTDGEGSHPALPATRVKRVRGLELQRAVMELGGKPCDIVRLGLPDAGSPDIDEVSRAERRLRGLVTRHQVSALFVASADDPHCDHQLANRIARDVQARCAGLRLFEYAIWARWRGHRVDGVTFNRADLRAAKKRAIKSHGSQQGRSLRCANSFTFPKGFASFFAGQPEVFSEVVA